MPAWCLIPVICGWQRRPVGLKGVIRLISTVITSYSIHYTKLYEKIMSLRGILSSDLMMIINNIEEPGRLADLVGSNLRLKISESQKILETADPVERLRLVADLLHT